MPTDRPAKVDRVEHEKIDAKKPSEKGQIINTDKSIQK